MQFSKKEIGILIILFLMVLFLYFLKLPVPCLFHELTGLLCPGCGITRMFVSIFKLDFVSAFNYNKLLFIYLILGIIYVNYYIVCYIFKFKIFKINDTIIKILLVITILFGIIRNFI